MRGKRDQAWSMSEPQLPLALIGLTFILAGMIKGVAGMGLPTLAIGLLGLAMPPAEAAALIVVPSLVTNVWQFAAGSSRWRSLRRLWPMLLTMIVVTWAATGLITGAGAGRAASTLGAALAVYAIAGVAKVRVSVPARAERWLSPLIGAATGIVTGATGVLVIPAAPYLQALNLEKEDLVQALGLSFTTSTLALAAGLASHDVFHLQAAGASILCTVPALLGMVVGQRVRRRIDPAAFKRVFFIGLFVLGGDLLLRSVL